jgi:hypothetical protein
MVESALGNLMASILSGGTAASATPKKAEPKTETIGKDVETRSDKAPESDVINLKELTPEQKSNLELALVMSGVKTPRLKNLMKQDSLDSGLLGAFAKIMGIPTTKGKTTTTPLEEGKSPKTETMPIPEDGRSKGTTIKGEEKKAKQTTTKEGDEKASKGTVMEIPEADLSKLIEMAQYTDFDEKNGKLMEVARQIAMKNKMHVKDVLAQAKRVYDERYQKTLESDLQKQAQKDGKVNYDQKLKSKKYQEDTKKAGEKYKAETPDYKYDDVKARNEAKGEEYTTERHSGEPSKEAVDKADDFVMKNAGRDYNARLDHAKNYSSIWGRNR